MNYLYKNIMFSCTKNATFKFDKNLINCQFNKILKNDF